jgi:probable HAF family extracellular repeat protein
MKSRILPLLTVMMLFIALAIPFQLAAQGQKQELPRYTVIDLGTLGGTFSQPAGLSYTGLVDGTSMLSGDSQIHAFVWRNGVMKDIGTLGGLNSYGLGQSSMSGQVAGGAESATPGSTRGEQETQGLETAL